MLFLARNGFRCIAPDRRGHGRSSQTWSGIDMNRHEDDLATLIDALDPPDVALVGCSTGGASRGRSGVRGARRRGGARGLPARLTETHVEQLTDDLLDFLTS